MILIILNLFYIFFNIKAVNILQSLLSCWVGIALHNFLFSVTLGIRVHISDPTLASQTYVIGLHFLRRMLLQHSVLNIRYRRYIGWQIIYRISGDILWYDTKYQTSFRTSYQMKNIHVITYINHMKLLKAKLWS